MSAAINISLDGKPMGRIRLQPAPPLPAADRPPLPAADRPPTDAPDGPPTEAVETFTCFGSTCSAIIRGAGPAGQPRAAAAYARRRMLAWHRQFSRFEPDSELSRLNADPRHTVRVAPLMAEFVQKAVEVARTTDGLVDPTLVGELEHAGYARHFETPSRPLREALDLAGPRGSATPNAAARWREVSVDRRAATVTRPPGLRLDSGGVAKGMFCDILAEDLRDHGAFVVDAGGDLALGGAAQLPRPVQVSSPFDERLLHVFELRRGAAATSGIGRRSWLDHLGRPAHHLLDPATGRPAFTGVVQVSALAPSAVEAEALAKAALLSGPGDALLWLKHGGVVVYDDGAADVVEADRRLASPDDPITRDRP